MKWYTLIVCLVLLASCIPPRKDSNKEKAENEPGIITSDEKMLIGWGGGKAEELVPGAADIGFDKLVVHHEDSANFRKFIALGKKNNIGIYAWFYLGDIPAWKKAFPDTEPPLQVMNDAENEAFRRIKADSTIGKSGYQYGGEPV